MALSRDDRRVALVSGGSRGIGAATVRRLASDGWDISFCHHGDERAARDVEKMVSELGVRVVAVEVDVTDAAQVAAWFRQTEDELGPAEAMVSCAGVTRDQPLAQLVDADWRTAIDTGLDGVFQLCRAAMFAMMKRRSGRIVTVSSVCAAYDHAAPGHDATLRPGMAGVVKALAGQAARFGINVNAVTPGPLTHDMTGTLPDKNRANLTETVTLRRFGDAASVADLVAFLLSEAAGDVTGSVLEVRSVISFLRCRLNLPISGQVITMRTSFARYQAAAATSVPCRAAAAIFVPRRTAAATAGLAAIVLLTAACGPNSGSGSAASPGASSSSASASPSPSPADSAVCADVTALRTTLAKIPHALSANSSSALNADVDAADTELDHLADASNDQYRTQDGALKSALSSLQNAVSAEANGGGSIVSVVTAAGHVTVQAGILLAATAGSCSSPS